MEQLFPNTDKQKCQTMIPERREMKEVSLKTAQGFLLNPVRYSSLTKLYRQCLGV